MTLGMIQSATEGKKISGVVKAFAAMCMFCMVLAAPNALAADKKASAKKDVAVQQVAAKVSINKADVDTLASLTGVGPAKAEAIVAYRKAHGGFKSIEQLTEVKGIGEATIAKNRSRLVL